MSDQENPEQKFALGLVGLIVAAIVASVIALGATMRATRPSANFCSGFSWSLISGSPVDGFSF